MSALHPLVAEVAERQHRLLRIIYAALAGLLLAALATTLLLDPPALDLDVPSLGDPFAWITWSLLCFAGILLGVCLPFVRSRLLAVARVQTADRRLLQAAGLPEDIDPTIGRQALYLTRFTAGMVLSWGLGAAVGLYGLVARMLGANALATGVFFALSALTLALLPPDRRRLERALASLL